MTLNVGTKVLLKKIIVLFFNLNTLAIPYQVLFNNSQWFLKNLTRHINAKIFYNYQFITDAILERALDSVQNQDYSNIESVVIDGNSNDGSLK